MSDEHGVKEFKELLEGCNELALYLVERLKDGVGADDLTDLMSKLMVDGEFKGKMEAAYEGLDKLGDEVKDIDLGEGVELAMVQLNYLPKYVEAFKK